MKKRLALLLPLLGLALSSCSFNDIVIRSSSQEASSSSNVPTSSSSKPATTLPSTYESLAKRSIYELSSIPTSVTETKFLVIPVWFANSSTLVSGTKPDIRGRIQKAFFGSEEETGWHSVKTYYERESHGKKVIEGVVSEWYESPKNAEYYAGSVDESTLTV